MPPKVVLQDGALQHIHDNAAHDALERAMFMLKQGKPEERSELSRRYAVTVTELEKVMAYFQTYVIAENGGGE